MVVVMHLVDRPMRNTRTGQFKIRCSCGWFHVGQSQQDVEKRAATHDREWVDVSEPLPNSVTVTVP